jgi:hypothetical protein
MSLALDILQHIQILGTSSGLCIMWWDFLSAEGKWERPPGAAWPGEALTPTDPWQAVGLPPLETEGRAVLG